MSQSGEYARGHVGGQTLYRCKILLGQTEFEPTARPCGSWRDLDKLRRGIQRNISFGAEQLIRLIPADHSFQEACNAWTYMTFLPALDV
ncbi:hypothetical protein DPX16_10677 [Anabarilius grahami]|uniref:Uncharacterized protein n=1 Tax=Anabarilius grahami TaxID=495550 RepID=A0A3N0Z7M8_ANAGA|nr:hypothetical protein DPX16_10677 [Anabarilius grahami]